MSELIKLEEVNAVDVFTGGGVDDLLGQIREEATSIVPDVSTFKGRKEIASIAAKVAKSKTYLDGLGKDLVSDWKAKSKAVDNERKKMRDTLDALKAEVRKPLTEWEEAEEKRLRLIKEKVEYFAVVCENLDQFDSASLKEKLEWVEDFQIDDSFEEFANEAAKNKDLAITVLKREVEKTIKREQEQIELEKLRKEAAEREQKEREEQLRREGEERAKKEAEAIQKAQAEQAEKERQAAIQAKEDAERRTKEAEENAARQAEEAAQKERDRIEAERVAEELAAKKREADKAHRAKINNAAMDALITAGVPKTHAKKVITVIAKGQVPHVRIDY